MPRKSFNQCLGETGQLISWTDQAYVENHIYVHNGACNTMCVQKMCGLVAGHLPSQKELLEVGQWAREEPGQCSARIAEFVQSRGLRKIGEYKGRWLYDELYAGNFIKQSTGGYCLLGIFNTQMSEGHALLVWERDDKWLFYDPNFGTAQFPYSNACLLSLKRVMQNIYSDFGPYFPFVLWRYSPW